MKLKTLLSLSASLALLACANLPELAVPGESTFNNGGANSLRSSDDYASIAVSHLDSASGRTGVARIPDLEQACWAAARAKNPDLLQEALSLYPAAPLPLGAQATFNTYTALHLALTEQARAALELLTLTEAPPEPRTQADYWLAKALAYRLLDDGEAATLMLVQRDAQLPEELKPANEQRIWDLQTEGSRFLFSDPLKRYDQTTLGWLALGRIARQFWTNELDVEDALLGWNAQFPGHPAISIYLPQASALAQSTLHSAIRRIALLLPTGGRLADAAIAVRDGFLAAHFGSGAAQLDVRVYDSGTNVINAYEQAVADGAELIVGPLDKAQVESVVARNGGRLPMLALNYRDQSDPSGSVLEYGLSPEDDARSVALRALEDGLTHALALTSNDDWGRRSLSAFEQAFVQGGGVLVDRKEFLGGAREYQSLVKAMMKLDDAQHRSEAIARLVGETLDTMPIRRQDVQFVFLAASPQQGRLLRPQFRFYHAADLPIYAAGRIYTGAPDPRADQDLDGIRFCAMPWLLDGSETWKSRRIDIENAWPERAQRYGRLYAMGTDAYLLASSLRNNNWGQLPTIAGATGSLSVQHNRVVRTQPCARFVKGVPRMSSRDT